MQRHPIHHIRHQAQKHQEAHSKLKELLNMPMEKENIWHVFLSTFVVVLLSLTIFMSWGRIVNFFTPVSPITIQNEPHGFKTGVLSNYKVDGQANDRYEKYMASIPAGGHLYGIETANLVGNQKEKAATIFPENALKNSIWLTNMISTGQHLTKLDQKRALAFQKSLLTTYYLGEKTVDINSTLQSDTKLLSQINNALAVDLFQYLDQSEDRAVTLNNYLNLLTILLDKADKRIEDLDAKIKFLQANSGVQEIQLKTGEQKFFDNLKTFNGPNAEEELGKFIGVNQAQTEVKAKIGAYKGLQDYYNFFRPTLDNLITAIKANRDPLIAGVKVVEIQDMTLPLIIKQK
jgi:hypothetical protein